MAPTCTVVEEGHRAERRKRWLVLVLAAVLSGCSEPPSSGAEGPAPDAAGGPLVPDGAPIADLAEGPIDGGADLARVPDCRDGRFLKRSDTEWTLGDRTYPVGVTLHHCADLPVDPQRERRALLELKTVNLGNSSCGSLRIRVITPAGKRLVSNGAQPGATSLYEAGRWEVQIENEYGCDRYRVSLRL